MLKKICMALLFLFAWEYLGQGAQLFPTPLALILRLWAQAPRFWFHTARTFFEILGGIGCATAIAFPLAFAMFRIRGVRSVMQPFFILLQCLPMFVLAPLMVIWFGWSYIAIVVPTTLMILFPLTMNIYKGMGSAPQPQLDFFQVNGASGWHKLIKLRIPYALPHIFTGFRVSAAVSGVGAIAGEWAGAQAGLGVLIQEHRRVLDVEGVFVALFCLTLLTLSVYGAVVLCEKCVLRRIRV